MRFSEMNKSAKRLLDRARNNLRVLLHTRLDRTQRRLLSDAKETLSLLEIEVCNTTLRKEELTCRTNPLEDQRVRTSPNPE